MPLEVLNEAVGKLNELHRPREKQKAWNTLGITFANNVISFGRRHGSRSVPRSACIKQFLSQWSHRRNVYARTAAHAAVPTRSTPDSVQVVRIERQIGFDLGLASHFTGLGETNRCKCHDRGNRANKRLIKVSAHYSALPNNIC